MIVLSIDLVLCTRRQREFDLRANIKWRENKGTISQMWYMILPQQFYFLIRTSFNYFFAILQCTQAQQFLSTFVSWRQQVKVWTITKDALLCTLFLHPQKCITGSVQFTAKSQHGASSSLFFLWLSSRSRLHKTSHLLGFPLSIKL